MHNMLISKSTKCTFCALKLALMTISIRVGLFVLILGVISYKIDFKKAHTSCFKPKYFFFIFGFQTLFLFSEVLLQVVEAETNPPLCLVRNNFFFYSHERVSKTIANMIKRKIIIVKTWFVFKLIFTINTV